MLLLRHRGHILSHTSCSLLFVILLCADLQAQSWNTEQASADAAGSAAANSALGMVGSQSGFESNISTPMTGGTSMTTLDSKTSFTAQLSCPSSSEFIAVTILPASTGDLSLVEVQQDTTMSGSYNNLYTVPLLVSGICANGIISCDAGTWDNCAYYTWASDTSGAVSLTEQTSIQSLSSCFCINNSCGSNLATTELSIILESLGTGVALAMQGVNPQYVITGSNIVDTTISYYGQQTSNCSSGSGSSSSGTSLTSYYNYEDMSSMVNDANSLISSQSTDTSSLYSLTTTASNNASGSSSSVECTITNGAAVSSSQIPTTDPIPYTIYSAADSYVDISLNGTSILNSISDMDSRGQAVMSTSFEVSPGEHTISITGYNYSGTPGLLFAMQNTGDLSWSLVSNSSWSGVCQDYGVTGTWGVPSAWPQSTAHWVWGCTTESSTISVTFNASLLVWQDIMNDPVTTDNCTAYETNSSCSLKEETADGVQTYANYNPTGLSPLASCQTFIGASQTFDICHSWWSKTQTYTCDGTGSYDFSDVQTRVTSISSSVTNGGSSMSYTDTRTDTSGAWVTESVSSSLTPTADTSCKEACKISRPSTNTQASSSGNASQYQTSTESSEVVYSMCSDGNPCPTEPGDTIEIDCQCINNFTEAATILSVLDSAGSDLICSSGETTSYTY